MSILYCQFIQNFRFDAQEFTRTAKEIYKEEILIYEDIVVVLTAFMCFPEHKQLFSHIMNNISKVFKHKR